ncbi:MAG: 50S ribosomal protein L15 [Planctomycetota bacterium]
MNLHEVNQGIEKHTKLMRVGRGIGSGKGKTSGRGGKGQTARAGYKALSIFQGGGTPLVRRIPKRGFTNSFALTVVSVNVADLDREFAAGDEVTPETLAAKGLISKRHDVVKILGDGELTKKLKVSAHRFSAKAKEKIEQSQGQLVVIPPRTPVAEKQRAAREAAGKKTKPVK